MTENRKILMNRNEALALADETDIADLTKRARALRDAGHGNVISYSRKVFIPLTNLCRDVCHYCTFAHPPRKGERAYMSLEEMTAIARAGAEAGCQEALFTLGDKPELRYSIARDELAELGHETTLSYLAEAAEHIFKETGLLPHANPGIMTADDIANLRKSSISQGIMLESAAARLSGKGGPHYGSPDKDPAIRLETIREAGVQKVPFTTGILIGIGETRRERIESLLAIRDLHEEFGHIQEIIIQNFRAKLDTKMADAPEPSLDELIWTIAVARILFGPTMNIQAPPNLSPGELRPLAMSGLNDWGGVSPVTPDHVNPEAPWPHLDELARQTAECGMVLTERLALYPAYTKALAEWVDPGLQTSVLREIDADGFARADIWSPGATVTPPALGVIEADTITPPIAAILSKVDDGALLDAAEVALLFQARGADFTAIRRAADALRVQMNGDVVSYVVNRNINYTNICYFKCQFCAFSKGKLSENLRGRPYDLGLQEIARRVREAWDRGATEVCMQGGIHPEYTGDTYLSLLETVKEVAPDMHIHAFTPLEIWQGAKTLGLEIPIYLAKLRDAGLGTLPGTAAEILDDRVRAIICPDKVNTAQWLEVMEAAHGVGLRTTATIMYGHVDGPEHWANHLLHIRDLQIRTGGFTEFVPLPFVPEEAPIYLKGKARRGPTYREAVLMHAVARLTLHPHITNIQASWVKMGPEGVKDCLNAGANDVGGTLMNESITRAAGASHGEEFPPADLEALIEGCDRTPRLRTTLYGDATSERRETAFAARELEPIVNTPAKRYERDERDEPRNLVRAG
jgi:FO synthase